VAVQADRSPTLLVGIVKQLKPRGQSQPDQSLMPRWHLDRHKVGLHFLYGFSEKEELDAQY
jgi:hypothetical protein